MLKICKYIDFICQICKRYARNMPECALEYAHYMPFYAINMQLYALNMQKICKYIDCIGQICKKYARNMPEIRSIEGF